MLAIGDASLDDCPNDIERRFPLTCSELSRLTDRISLINSWHAAAAPTEPVRAKLDERPWRHARCSGAQDRQRKHSATAGSKAIASDAAMTEVDGRPCAGLPRRAWMSRHSMSVSRMCSSRSVTFCCKSCAADLRAEHLCRLSGFLLDFFRRCIPRALVVPAVFLVVRAPQRRDRNIPMLLVITTFACGPLGGLGCAFMALTLRRRRPAPARLRYWYEYIAGIVARERTRPPL